LGRDLQGRELGRVLPEFRQVFVVNARSGDPMKAIVLKGYGGIEKLEAREVPEPQVGPNEVKVRTVGASINPVDWKLRSGALKWVPPLEFPVILGRDTSGHVVELGPRVTRLKVGDRVMGLVNRAYAELVVAELECWAEVPGSLDLVDAGALPLVVLTGAQLIEETVRPRSGDLVIVTGALGSVGRAAVFAARACGARVLAGVRRRNRAQAATLGAERVVSLDDDAEVADLPNLDGIADTVGGETVAKLLGKVKPGGTVGSVLGEPPGARERGLTVRALRVHPDASRLAELGRAVAEGDLVIPIAKRLPFAEVREAHQLAESGAGGKIVLTA